jgi:diguanylate cyclase (GGDEF)-like protein
MICRDESERYIDMSVASIRNHDRASLGVVLVFRDVTEERELARQLAHQASHDRLTGLVNRHEFERRLSHLLDTASPQAPHALLYLDLDQFKIVNDTCGHAAGDDLLRQISALLRTKLRARDTLARLGGDEFGVLLEHCAAAEAERVANNLREVLQSFRFRWNDKGFTIGVSIGLVPITQTGETLADVFSAADSACYAAKEKGRNRVHIYRLDDTVLAQRHGEMRWIPRIQQALADGRFRLYYQPIVPLGPNARNGIHGEILLRMLDETGRLVLPGAFLPAGTRPLGREQESRGSLRPVERQGRSRVRDQRVRTIAGRARFSELCDRADRGHARIATQTLLRDHRDVGYFGARSGHAFHRDIEVARLQSRAG